MTAVSPIGVVRPDNPIVSVISGKNLLGEVTQGLSSRQRLQSNPESVANLLNVAFWASLAREEGRPVSSGFAIASPDDAPDAFRFDASVPFTLGNVIRLGTVAGIRTRLVVHDEEGKAAIWGLAKTIKPHCVTVWFDRPARLRASFDRNYVLGVIEHGQTRVTPGQAITPKWNAWLRHAAILLINDFSSEFIRDTSDLANEACRHGHGGTILLVPADSDDWMSALDIRFRAKASSQGILANNLLSHRPPILDTAAARQVADFTRIDGALVLTSKMDVVGFGAWILTSDVEATKLPIVTRSVFEEDFSDLQWPALGGTRHQSAARFVAQNPKTAAFVSSSDGGLTLFACKEEHGVRKIARLTELETFIVPG